MRFYKYCQQLNIKMSKNFSRVHVYISTLLIYFGNYFTLGMISRIKYPMSEEFNFSASFLGLLDGMLFCGSALGFMYIAIFPPKRPVFATFVFALGLIITMEVGLLSVWVPSLAPMILLTTRLLFGFFFSIQILAQTVLNFHFNKAEDEPLLEIWFGVGALGDSFGILACELFLNFLDLNWYLTTSACMLIFAICVIYMVSAIDEVFLQEQQPSQDNQTSDNCKVICQHFKNGLNIINGLTFLLLTSNYYVMLLWLPNYLLRLGFQGNASFISMLYPIAFAVGTFIFRPLLTLSKTKIGFLFLGMMLINNGASVCLCFLPTDSAYIPAYYSLVLLISLFSCSYFSYTVITDLKYRTNGHRQFLIINSFVRFLIRCTETFNFIICGKIGETDEKGFMKFYTGIIISCTLLLILRLIKYPDSYNENSETITSKNYEQICQ